MRLERRTAADRLLGDSLPEILGRVVRGLPRLPGDGERQDEDEYLEGSTRCQYGFGPFRPPGGTVGETIVAAAETSVKE